MFERLRVRLHQRVHMLMCYRPQTPAQLARHPAPECATDSYVLRREERLQVHPHVHIPLYCRPHTNTVSNIALTHFHTSHIAHPLCVPQTTMCQSEYVGCSSASMFTCSWIAGRTPTQRATHLHTRNMTHTQRASQAITPRRNLLVTAALSCPRAPVLQTPPPTGSQNSTTPSK